MVESKRRSGFEYEPADKRLRSAVSDELLQIAAGGPDPFGGDVAGLPLEAEYYIEQRLVGWIIGKSGAALKEVEDAYQVKVAVDQGSKELGYSKVLVSGNADAVQQASEHINTSLARAAHGSGGAVSSVGPFLLDCPPTGGGDHLYEEIQIDQNYIGWLLGKSGAAVREMEQQSGCKICINQETKSQGYSKAQLHGSGIERELAKSLIRASVERAAAGGGAGAPMAVRQVESEMQIEQKWVGWLLGKGGGVIKEIETETEVRIKVDQSTQQFGYSTIRIGGGSANVDVAQKRIGDCLQKVGGTASIASQGGPAQIKIDQQFVGWLLGKAGGVVKEIEVATGAKVKINQDTKLLGYSIAEISGDYSAIVQAEELINEKLARVNPSMGKGSTPGKGSPAKGPITSGQYVKPAAAKGQAGKGPIDLRLLGQSWTEEPTPPWREPQANQRQGIWPASPTRQPTLQPVQAQQWQAEAPGAQTAVEVHVEQRLIGWVLGKKGQAVREVEVDTGAKIVIDQSTKDQGFSTARITGQPVAVELAHQRIQASLARVSGDGDAAAATDATLLSTGSMAEDSGEMQVEQRMVGWILGKSGVVLKEIETTSGARIAIDQSTKDFGYSTVRITGGQQQCSSARLLISQKLSDANR